MEEPKFTKGPWGIHAIDPKTPCACLMISGADHPIGTVERGKWGDTYLSIRQVGASLEQRFEPYEKLIEYGEIPEDVALANARLIAAAPTLYEALLNLVSCKWVSGTVNRRVDEARAALALVSEATPIAEMKFTVNEGDEK